jgi:hypothetical protein
MVEKAVFIFLLQIEMVGPSGASQKPAATTKDVLIDFLAGGTGSLRLSLFDLETRMNVMRSIFYF